MSVFFNGRLYVSPTTMSTVDDSALANQNLSVGNVVALIGASEGGEPNKALRFGSPSEAQAVLRSGELLNAVQKAFDPSSQTDGPSTVVVVRVNPAARASLNLKDGSSNDVISLQSTDYGAYTNQIKVKVESGSTAGKKITTQLGDEYYTQDNIARNAFQVQYTGPQLTATMSITGTIVTLQAPSGSTVASIDLSVYRTIQQLADRINSVGGFAAAVLEGNAERISLNGLDYVSAVDVKTSAYTARADLQAVIDWINNNAEGYLNATRAADAGAAPANIGFTYLTGGTNGVITNQDWSNAYTTLQAEGVQWVCPVTPEPSIHAMNDAHCAFMSTVARSERRGIVGTQIGTTDSAAISAAKALNSDRTSLVHIGFYDYDAQGALVLYPPYILAALLAGAFSGVNPGTALTNKSIKARGLERNLRNPTDTDVLIQGGVMCVENTPNGYKVVKSISTWLTNTNYNRVEVSVGAAVDFVSRSVRLALDVLRGEKSSQTTLSRAASITDSTLRELARPEPQGPGVIVGNAQNPAYKNINASIDGDVLRVEFQCSPVIPVNYIPITIFAVPFSGSVAA